ncbi:hypothetical protein Leryth_010537 [Lithospermum erythrorhizon]|nr:hypothetical protein Leryth_010537 [Lithospermum erythrorhizon]
MNSSSEYILQESSEMVPQEPSELKPQESRKHRFLSNEEKKLMFERLLKALDKGKLKKGAIKSIADSFSVNTRTVKRFWEKAIAFDMDMSPTPVQHSSRSHHQKSSAKSTSLRLIPSNTPTRMKICTEMILPESSEMTPQESIELKPQESRKHTFLSNEEKKLMFECLLKALDKGKLQRGAIKSIADSFSVNSRTVKRFWEKALAKASQANDGASEQTPKRGRRRIVIDPEKAAEIDLNSHTSIRSLAKALNMSCSTLHRRFQEEGSNAFALDAVPHSFALDAVAHSFALDAVPRSFALDAVPLNVIRFEASSSNMEEGGTGPAVAKRCRYVHKP